MIVPLTHMQVYVVNLRRRLDRRAQIQSQLTAVNAIYTSDLDGPFDGLTFDVRTLTRSGYTLFDWQIDSENPWWSRPLKYGEIGCTLSHLACWRHAAAHEDGRPIIVLEDDAVLAPHFYDRLDTTLQRIELAGGCDLLYLGRYPIDPDQPAGPGLVKPGYSHCSFGYLLAPHAPAMLLAAGLERGVIPVDEFLPAMYVDHPRPDVRRRYPPRLTALACDPPLVFQMPKAEAGSDTEDSPFVTTVDAAG